MALNWTAKPADAVYRLTWTVPVIAGDTLTSATLTVSSGDAVIDGYETDGVDVIAFVSGGTAGTTTLIAATATTGDGETIAETIYLPIRSATAQTVTGQDVCNFALRPVVGVGETAESTELADALEKLNDMLAGWLMDGLDVGAPVPILASTELNVRNEFVPAIKYNLRLLVVEEYGLEPRPYDQRMAQEYKDQARGVLFNPADLTFDRALQSPRPMTGIDDV